MAVSEVLIKSSIYQKILSIFPSNLSYAFAYGSGVFLQKGHTNIDTNMLDLVFVTSDPLSWHSENVRTNYKHYSFLKYGGPHLIAYVQQHMGAGVYYNTMVPFEKRFIKYGVISTDHLISDLLDWEYMYISGRLQKPVLTLIKPTSADLQKALIVNLRSSIHTALLLLPEVFTEQELFETIASLSYLGDFRMIVGEDKNKIKNIVSLNVDRFRELYATILSNTQHIIWNKNAMTIEQDCSSSCLLYHLNMLPKRLLLNLSWYRNLDGRYRDMEDTLCSLAHDSEYNEYVAKGVQDIVRSSSIFQSSKGIITGGIIKSIKYSTKKLKKMWHGKQR